jgi:hypothetical protein
LEVVENPWWLSAGSVQSWSIPGNLWWFRRICAGLECFRRSVVLSASLAVGDLGLLVDSVVTVGDLGLSEGSGVAVGNLGCRQVLGWLLEFFLVADCWCHEGSGVADLSLVLRDFFWVAVLVWTWA